MVGIILLYFLRSTFTCTLESSPYISKKSRFCPCILVANMRPDLKINQLLCNSIIQGIDDIIPAKLMDSLSALCPGCKFWYSETNLLSVCVKVKTCGYGLDPWLFRF